MSKSAANHLHQIAGSLHRAYGLEGMAFRD